MVTPDTIPPNTYRHKINFGYIFPSRWWFLWTFITGRRGADYWYDSKFRGILIYREEKSPHATGEDHANN